jgi:acetyltransferase-like isoleucine patch superfamily enzyme
MNFSLVLDNIIHIADKLETGKVVVFGTGKGGRLVSAALQVSNIEVDFFVDNSQGDHNKEFLGKSYFNASALTEDASIDFRILIASHTYASEIAIQLNDMGFEEGKTYFRAIPSRPDSNCPYFLENTVVNDVPVGRYTYGYGNFVSKYVCSVGSFSAISRQAYPVGNRRMDRVSMCMILYHAHPHSWQSLQDKASLDLMEGGVDRSIVIGNDVWIATNAVIMKGITIGDGAVVGAGAIVNKDVPSYAIVAGVPARIIRYRFEPHIIEKLLEIKWWDWPIEKIRDNFDKFYDINAFVETFSKS